GADDFSSPAAAALRRSRAELVSAAGGPATTSVTVPLRGRRRALGTMLFEGLRLEPGGELDLLNRADQLGRQLSHAIGNIQLPDGVVRSRRELENTLNAINDLIIVVDLNGRIIHANRAFARAIEHRPDQLADRPLTELVGPDLADWLSRMAGD